ncbi:EF-hand domain-containing protein [Plastoroseomonas hellenica]|uniref:EF-hand domain-containing protein n=1 Tax=Plastoroseomonas hellenica TaxID=2687306 RepID=UPI001BA564FB|nr:EF-hand domain-containing protein [Plastoroseomonas hellenica]MBR0647931.1 hypothetical protein [Plastoroseomonas hellenica]
MQVSPANSAQALEMANRMRERMFARADQDGSGGLSLDEFRAGGPGKSRPGAAGSAGGTAATGRPAQVFNALDTDGDGTVSAAELEAGRAARSAQGGAFSAGSMAALLSGQEASGTGGADDVFARLDSDDDGSLTAVEFAARRPRATGEVDDDTGSPLASASDDASGTSQADTLAELVRRAMETYLQAAGTRTQATSTLTSA